MGTVDSRKPMPRDVYRNRSRKNYDFNDYQMSHDNNRRYSETMDNLNFYTHNFQETNHQHLPPHQDQYRDNNAYEIPRSPSILMQPQPEILNMQSSLPHPHLHPPPPTSSTRRQPSLQVKTQTSRPLPTPFVVPNELKPDYGVHRKQHQYEDTKANKTLKSNSINPPVVNPNHETLKKLYDIKSYEMKKLQKLFNEYAGVDRNMNFQEFVRLYGSINPGLRGPDIVNIAEEAFLASDTNDDGLLNFDEFLIAYCLTKPGRSFVGFPDLFKPNADQQARVNNMLPYYPSQPEVTAKSVEEQNFSIPEQQAAPAASIAVQSTPVETKPASNPDHQVLPTPPTPTQVPPIYQGGPEYFQPQAAYPPPPYYMHPAYQAYPAYPIYSGVPPPPPIYPSYYHHPQQQMQANSETSKYSNKEHQPEYEGQREQSPQQQPSQPHHEYSRNYNAPPQYAHHYAPPSEVNTIMDTSDFSQTESTRPYNRESYYNHPNNNNNNQPDQPYKFDLSQLPPIDQLTHKFKHREFKHKSSDHDYHYTNNNRKSQNRIVDDHPPLFSKSELRDPSLTVKSSVPVRRSNLARRRTRC